MYHANALAFFAILGMVAKPTHEKTSRKPSFLNPTFLRLWSWGKGPLHNGPQYNAIYSATALFLPRAEVTFYSLLYSTSGGRSGPWGDILRQPTLIATLMLTLVNANVGEAWCVSA